MNFLITGGAGFIGSHLSEQLLQEGHKIHVWDNLSTGNFFNIEHLTSCSNFTFHHKDILKNSDQLDSFLQKEKIHGIYHLAAIASVQDCQEYPYETHLVNNVSSLKLLNLAIENKVPYFIFASSAAVFGNLPELPKTEKSPISPISFYGTDKFAVENYLKLLSIQKKIKGTSFRFFNVFGPRQDPTSPYSGVLSIFLKEVLSSKKPKVKIFGDGLQTRDFIFVKDVISALLLPLKNEKMSGEVFNLGQGKETSLLDVIKILEEISGKNIQTEFFDSRNGDIKYSYADRGKIEQFGHEIEFSVKDGLRSFF